MKKRIVIHAGPPKSGSSALQYWLLKHREELSQRGFFYPEHTIDINGTSSGHRRMLLSEHSGKKRVDAARCHALVREFEDRGEHTLILSSEYFAFFVEALSGVLSDAIFVFYCRNPIESLASQYNQQVKRNHERRDFESWLGGQNKTFLPLSKIEQALRSLGPKRVVIRAYTSSTEDGVSLVADFLDAIDCSWDSPESARMNQSYSSSALEFKRLVNHFNVDGALLRWLDKVLQHYPGPHHSVFALLADTERELLLQKAQTYLSSLFSTFGNQVFAHLIDDLAALNHHLGEPFRLGEAQTMSILNHLCSVDAKRCKAITKGTCSAELVGEELREAFECVATY